MLDEKPNTKPEQTTQQEHDQSTQQPVQKVPINLPIKEPAGKRNKSIFIIIVVTLVLAVVGWFTYTLYNNVLSTQNNSSQPAVVQSSKVTEATDSTTTVAGVVLDTAKNYGNKYANGILPVGDEKYVTSDPKKGYIYTCTQYAQSFKTDNIGAETRGPWFINNNTQYDINKKVSVQGSVSWKGSFSNKVTDSIRTIVTNDLPLAHSTGTFPVASSDPAYSYDRNPNTISSQDLTYKLSASPTYGDPECMSGEVGVMLTGVSLFNGFDAGARDAGAWEVQDSCGGHPQITGQYHYHTLSSCIDDINVDTVIGFAIDGFPITGPKVGKNNILTTSDLDVCHGITSKIKLDGKDITMYHYVMTQDFPYSVSCFRAKAGTTPGTGEGQKSDTQNTQPGGQTPPDDTTGQGGPPPVGGPPPQKN